MLSQVLDFTRPFGRADALRDSFSVLTDLLSSVVSPSYKYIDDNYTTISVTEKIDKIIGEKDLDDFKKIIIMHR